MSTTELVPSLGLVTLIIVLLAVGAALIWFLRKPSNRHPMDHHQERNVAADLDAERPARDNSPPS